MTDERQKYLLQGVLKKFEELYDQVGNEIRRLGFDPSDPDVIQKLLPTLDEDFNGRKSRKRQRAFSAYQAMAHVGVVSVSVKSEDWTTALDHSARAVEAFLRPDANSGAKARRVAIESAPSPAEATRRRHEEWIAMDNNHHLSATRSSVLISTALTKVGESVRPETIRPIIAKARKLVEQG